MRVSGCVAAVCVTACLVLALPAKALADARDQETVFTFSGDIEIPGKVLRAGTYVFRIADTVVDRHMVLVFDRTGRFVAMTLTVAATRLSDGWYAGHLRSPIGRNAVAAETVVLPWQAHGRGIRLQAPLGAMNSLDRSARVRESQRFPIAVTRPRGNVVAFRMPCPGTERALSIGTTGPHGRSR